MKKYIVHLVLLVVTMIGVTSLAAVPAFAVQDPINQVCTLEPNNVICTGRTQKLFGPDSVWTRIVNTFIYVIGAVAVIMIVIGGMRYTLSGGDQSQIKSAKDTILYAIIGIVIALSAYGIVNFVLSKM